MTFLPSTLLDTFLSIARSDGMDRNIVECGNESWTYGDLDAISTGLALELHQKYGLKPVVAVICESENHPYVLAILFATWKLGGIFAPLNNTFPREILEGRLHIIAPTCVLVPFIEPVIQNILKELSLPCLPFDPTNTTVTALSQRYKFDHAPKLSTCLFPVPTPEDIALYLQTSSPSSASNVKCVPISHKNLINSSQAGLSWCQKTWPQQDFNHLRVLGWSPWCFTMCLSHDIGGSTLLTAGCYIFSTIPTGYPTRLGAAKNSSLYTQLLDTAISKKTTVFAGLPFILEGFIKMWKNELDMKHKARIMEAIKLFKTLLTSGAPISAECIEWAKQVGLPLVNAMGLTEVGGPLFLSDINNPEGWFAHECLIPDAELSLIYEQGRDATEGELVIKSHLISKGYLHLDNSAFTIDSDGAVTFRTGDIYGYGEEQRLVWKGRKEDYIEMSFGCTFDPRDIEAILDQSPAIARSCVVGNNFTKSCSQFICAIVEPARDVTKSSDVLLSEIKGAIALANRGLDPNISISWARVLVLKDQHTIPITKKGAVFRKNLDRHFGEQLASLVSGSEHGDVEPI